jgi:DNA-binding SARP family transcriptional activator
LLLTQQEYAPAVESWRWAIERAEALEAAQRELMRCCARLGERGQALRHFQAFEPIIRDELGSAPTAKSAARYQRLKRGEEVGASFDRLP